MAELATLARPYAEALYQVAITSDVAAIRRELDAVAAVAANDSLRQFADNPKADPAQVHDVIVSVAGTTPSPAVRNLLEAVIHNGRLSVLPEIAAQFRVLVNQQAGVSDAVIHSAFPIDAAQLADLQTTLERRFGRKLDLAVEIQPELIGGIRVVVGDEVLDTSVKARLEQMKVALTA